MLATCWNPRGRKEARARNASAERAKTIGVKSDPAEKSGAGVNLVDREQDQMDSHQTHQLTTVCACIPLLQTSAGRELTIQPARPRGHSSTKPAEQRPGTSCLMNEPSVTATYVPSLIASASQLLSPTRRSESQSQVLPHSCKTTSTGISQTS